MPLWSLLFAEVSRYCYGSEITEVTIFSAHSLDGETRNYTEILGNLSGRWRKVWEKHTEVDMK
jgi:hypothetical protein